MRNLFAALAVLLPTLAHAQDKAAGQTLFQAQCSACHSTEPGVNNQGPSLAGLFGRKAATAPGFSYSNALTTSGLVWDTATLDAFLANPKRKVPGTTMAIAIPRAPQRADLIAYLETLK